MDHESYSVKGFFYTIFCQQLVNNRHEIDGLKIFERFFTLPLDYSNANGEKIRVFARHIIPKSKAKTLEDEAKLPFRKPCLVPCSSFVVVYYLHCVSLVLDRSVSSIRYPLGFCRQQLCKVVPDSKSMRHIGQAI